MFLEHLNHAKAVEPFVLVVATAGESYVPGEALVIGAAGTVTKCTGANVPQFICQSKKENAVAGDVISVTLVNEQQMLEAPLSVAGTSLKVGNKVTVGTDGVSVTATTESGVFLITEILGTAIGDKVRGYFKR
jgi:hypothetical protein